MWLPVSPANYFLVIVAALHPQPSGAGYDVAVTFQNNGNQAAVCVASLEGQRKQFALEPFGRDAEVFAGVSAPSRPRVDCWKAGLPR